MIRRSGPSEIAASNPEIYLEFQTSSMDLLSSLGIASHTVFDEKKEPTEQDLSKLESGGKLYVAANHWPRAWYNRALENPRVQATFAGEKRDYTAVPVSGSEHDRVDGDNALGVVFRILTGFPPRYFLRLDPR